MSFRIDDILSKGNSTKTEVDNKSILEETLLSKTYFYKELYGFNGKNWPWGFESYKDHLQTYLKYNYQGNPQLHYQLYPIKYLKKKGGQVRFTTFQTDTLEKRFVSNKYLTPEERRQLAQFLKLTDRQVKTWFQNRRAKWRRSNLNLDKTCKY